ncbi:MAG: universal stress protein [Polyangia bacterium]
MNPVRTEGVILVGVGFGPPSRRALRRAEELAQGLGCKLRLVHAAAESSAELAVPEFVKQQLEELPDFAERMQTTVQAWAAFLAGVVVPTAQICAVRGNPLSVLLQEAARPDVVMVVLGRSERASARRYASLAHQLLRICPCPVLVMGTRGHSRVVLAATDCAEERLPVLWAASALVPALGDKLVAVHNVGGEAEQRAAALGQPLTPQIASRLCTDMQEWLDARKDTHELLLTNEVDDAEGVLAAARSRQADLLVVGARSDLAAGNRTAEILLDECSVSVLFIPLGRGREAPCGLGAEGSAPPPLAEQAMGPTRRARCSSDSIGAA